MTEGNQQLIFSKQKKKIGPVPPTGLVLLSICSTQVGAAFAKSLFATLSPAGIVALRLGFAALVLLVVWRPKLKGYTKTAYINCCLFGLSLAMMNLLFYSAIAHIPLGVAVTLEFVGPLSVAILGSKKALDILWIVLAASGILCLAPWTGTSLNVTGMILALLAGGCWALYIVLGAKVSNAIPGISGLAIAMSLGAMLIIPFGLISSGTALFQPKNLLIGSGIAILSSVIPYSLEINALRKMPTNVFSLLMSLEPAIAALVGMLLLHEAMEWRTISAIILITIATIGTIRGRREVNKTP